MSAPPSVLFDAPGPRARRRARIFSWLSLLVFLVLAVLVVLRLDSTGQLVAERWAPLLWPADDQFPQVWERLLLGLRSTLLAAALAIVFSLVLGTAVTVVRLLLGRWGRMPVVALVEVLRGSPVVLLIFFTYAALPLTGFQPGNFWYLVIGLTLYNFVVIGEILRAGVAALSKGQAEAGLAIGLTPRQTLLLIQLPQAFRLMLPALISQLVVIVKDTSLAAIVLTNSSELLNTGEQVAQFLRNPLQTYTVIAAIYIIVNVLLGRLAIYTEQRLSRSSGDDAPAGDDEEAARLEANAPVADRGTSADPGTGSTSP